MSWALVENGSVVKELNGKRCVTINGVQHPVTIFGPSWTDEERARIGLYPIEENANLDSAFYEPTGSITYELVGEVVRCTREMRAVEPDFARGHLVKRINQHADGLINAAMPKEKRDDMAFKLSRLIYSHGSARSKWPSAVVAEVENDLAAYDYCKTIESERSKRLADAEKLGTVAEIAAYDFRQGWPF